MLPVMLPAHFHAAVAALFHSGLAAPTSVQLQALAMMRLSTRDLARVGQLMLRNGRWNGTQFVPVEWVRYSTSLITPFARIQPDQLSVGGQPDRWGYGAMWWVWEEPMFPGRRLDGPAAGRLHSIDLPAPYGCRHSVDDRTGQSDSQRRRDVTALPR